MCELHLSMIRVFIANARSGSRELFSNEVDYHVMMEVLVKLEMGFKVVGPADIR